jgi:hypothetical protein
VGNDLRVFPQYPTWNNIGLEPTVIPFFSTVDSMSWQMLPPDLFQPAEAASLGEPPGGGNHTAAGSSNVLFLSTTSAIK